ncbi:MAG: cation:proton antiporter [Candidatus Sumerlaeia bacterium]|nr:cation:proton antiporter [Candidatus Sumerlaeia bacterium]
MDSWNFLKDLLVLLAAAVLFGALFERARLNAILGYLFAGTLVGPGMLGLVPAGERIAAIAEIGIALLLFTIGLEFSVRRLLALGRVALLGGVLQIAATIAAVAAAASALELPIAAGVALGAILAPSSTAAVLRLLRERGELDTVRGRNALGILLLQDAALVPLVLLITSLRSTGDADGSAMGTVLRALAALALFGAGVDLASRFVMPLLFRALSGVRSRELFVVMAMALCLGAAYAAHAVGLSPALGAFVAGVLLAESPFSAQLRSDVGGVRILFVTLFFTSVGMLADFEWLADHFLLAAGVTGALLGGKALVVFAVLRLLRVGRGPSLSSGLLLAQGGEFSFVLAAMAAEGGGLIDRDTFQLVSTCVLATLFATPFLVAAAPFAEERLRAGGSAPDPDSAAGGDGAHGLAHHHIVVGFGPAGRRVVESLRERGERVVVLELNPQTVERARNAGLLAEVGDASQAEVLEHCGVGTAASLVVTIPDHDAATRIIEQARGLAAGLPIYARARLRRHMPEMLRAGADLALDEEDQVGLALSAEICRRHELRLAGVQPDRDGELREAEAAADAPSQPQ